MVAPDPRDPGGITGVISAWKAAGLGERVELVELPTSAWDSPPWRQLGQAGKSLARFVGMLVRGPRPDVVHLHASIGGSLLRKLIFGWACRAARVPYVIHMHSGAFDHWVSTSARNRTAARSLFGRSAAAIVLAERWRDTAAALGAGRVVVVPNAISARQRAELARCRKPGTNPTHEEDGRPVLLFYGRWAPIKGADRLAEALRALSARDYEVRLWGNGDRDWLERQFSGLPGEVQIGGWLGGERKLAELARADVLLAPSRSEGFPSSLVEARAAGVPVIATDVGAAREALAGYPAAILLDAEDDAGLRQALARVLDRSWPEPYEPGEVPEALRAEPIIDRLVTIYAELTRG